MVKYIYREVFRSIVEVTLLSKYLGTLYRVTMPPAVSCIVVSNLDQFSECIDVELIM